MSATVINRVVALLTTANLLTGYAVKKFRWTDADADGNTPFILFRQSGEGNSDVLLQQPQVTITLVDNPAGAVTADARAEDIVQFLRAGTVAAGITRIDPIGGVRGPMYLENGRPVFEIVCRVFTEDL